MIIVLIPIRNRAGDMLKLIFCCFCGSCVCVGVLGWVVSTRMSDTMSPIDNFMGFFKGMRFLGTQGTQSQLRASELSAELRDLLLQGLQNKAFDRDNIDGLIGELTRVGRGSKVDALIFSSGPWQAVYSKNSQPLWEKQAKYLPVFKNRAWQEYDLAAGTVVNVGQIMGEAVFISVEGAVSEQSLSDTTPKYYTADIQRGALNAFGLRFPLPIKGKGVAKLLYQDSNLRIFESPKESESEWEQEGLIVVQMPLASVP